VAGLLQEPTGARQGSTLTPEEFAAVATRHLEAEKIVRAKLAPVWKAAVRQLGPRRTDPEEIRRQLPRGKVELVLMRGDNPSRLFVLRDPLELYSHAYAVRETLRALAQATATPRPPISEPTSRPPPTSGCSNAASTNAGEKVATVTTPPWYVRSSRRRARFAGRRRFDGPASISLPPAAIQIQVSPDGTMNTTREFVRDFVLSALNGRNISRIRTCPAAGCGWLYLAMRSDQSTCSLPCKNRHQGASFRRKNEGYYTTAARAERKERAERERAERKEREERKRQKAASRKRAGGSSRH